MELEKNIEEMEDRARKGEFINYIEVYNLLSRVSDFIKYCKHHLGEDVTKDF